ncbi:MAG: hypothetical protein ACLSA6_18085 [Holdemania massiliensis]
MIGNASGLPAASMVLPMIGVVGFNCTTSVCAVPVQIKNLAQLLAGSWWASASLRRPLAVCPRPGAGGDR